LWGVPLLARTLRRLEDWGVTDFFINTHWRPEAVREFLDHHETRARVTLSHEPEILGTGGALRAFEKQLDGEPFWVVNGDIAFSLDPAPLLRAFDAQPCVASVWLKPGLGPCTVETDSENRVTCWRSATPRAPNTATLAGVHLVSPEIFRFFPGDKNSFSILEPWQAAERAGLPVFGVRVEPSFWADIGTHASYFQAHAEILKSGGSILLPSDLKSGGSILLPSDLPGFVVTPPIAPVSENTPPHRACLALDWNPAHTVVSHLGARGSNREFWRVASPHASAIVIQYSGQQRAENLRYAPLTHALLDVGVPVPRVLHEIRNPDRTGLLVLQDLGDLSLQSFLQTHPDPGSARLPAYTQILNEIHHFHNAAQKLDLDLEPYFDASLYAWEQNLFEEHLLLRCGKPGFPPQIREEYARVTERLLASPRTVVHRDLQSTNLLLHENRWHFIDFQGMRRGAIVYDLASLLCDPYVSLPARERDALLRHYVSLCDPAIRDRLLDDFHFAVVQRLTQAMGAYGRLTALGHAEFQTHLAPAARLLSESAQRCGLHAIQKMVLSWINVG